MPIFTPSHLGKWEPLFSDLLDGETSPLTEEGTWMLADRSGLVAVFDDGEPVYIGSAEKLGRELQIAVAGVSDDQQLQ